MNASRPDGGGDLAPTAAELADAARALGTCRRLLVLAGAGLSADAGVPTFRGDDGLYRDPRCQFLASAAGFAAEPDAVWTWYHERREQVSRCQPHPGQRALAVLQRALGERLLIATTNEDDLLERAGVSEPLHLHGSFFDTACAAGCGWRVRDDQDNSASFLDCPRCGAAVRPGSVWFGEPVDDAAFARIEAFAPEGCLVIGSSHLVQPAAGLPINLALAGHPVVDVNPAESPLAQLGARILRGRALGILPPLVDLLSSEVVQEQARRRSG